MVTASYQAGLHTHRRRVVQHLSLIAQWLILLGLVAVSLSAAVLLDQGSRLFLLKNVLAVTLSILPGSIYLLFISAKGQRLYDEFVLNLYRLRIDRLGNLPAPPQHTTYYAEWKQAHAAVKSATGSGTRDNLYRAKFEAIFGPRAVSTRELIDEDGRPPNIRDRTQTFAPIVLATFLLGIGWTFVVEPDAVRQLRLVQSFNGAPSVPYEALRFGFLGAYWFILQDLVRRYFRDDLKTDGYISAVSRLVVVSLLVLTIGLIPLGTVQQQQVFAFLIGVFPQIGLEVLKGGVQSAFGKLVPTLRTRHPLSSLDGLTIWDQARLLEEGIEDLENLATANLVDVLLSMRVPVARLVDWMDQAILLVHLPDDNDVVRSQLQRLGIRTATDLEAAWAEASEAGRDMLSLALFGPDATTMHGCAFLTALGREPNIEHLRMFRRRDWLHESR